MRLRWVVVSLIAAFVVAGCGRDRVMNPIVPPVSKYPKLLNPYSVLDALQVAYRDRDTTEIKLIYDANYVGTSIDQSDPSPTTLTFTKGDEVAHVAALARSSSITSVSMTQISNRARTSDMSDPPGWATIRDPIASLEVSDATATHNVDIANITMEFKFIPTTPAPSSPTDTTWKIIRWTEIRQ